MLYSLREEQNKNQLMKLGIIKKIFFFTPFLSFEHSYFNIYKTPKLLWKGNKNNTYIIFVKIVRHTVVIFCKHSHLNLNTASH